MGFLRFYETIRFVFWMYIHCIEEDTRSLRILTYLLPTLLKTFFFYLYTFSVNHQPVEQEAVAFVENDNSIVFLYFFLYLIESSSTFDASWSINKFSSSFIRKSYWQEEIYSCIRFRTNNVCCLYDYYSTLYSLSSNTLLINSFNLLNGINLLFSYDL